MSLDLGRDVPHLEKLYARKLWADFSHPSKDKVLRRVLSRERFIEGAWKVLRRQKHVLLQSTTPFACTLLLKQQKILQAAPFLFCNELVKIAITITAPNFFQNYQM